MGSVSSLAVPDRYWYEGTGDPYPLRQALPIGAYTLLAFMKRFHPQNAYVTAVALRFTVEYLNQHREFRIANMAGALTSQLTQLRAQLDELDLEFSITQIDRILSMLAGDLDADSGYIADQVETLHQRIHDELTSTYCLQLSKAESQLYAPSTPLLGADVAADFQSAGLEIEEVGKCLALRRSTAAVFHLMRTVEIGIRSVARCLGIPDPLKPAERNWGAILRAVKGEMDRRNGAKPPTWARADDRQFFDEAYTSLDAVRNAWRNTTMHVELRYSEEQAEDIFAAVRGFMRKLASRCDENGDPKA